jgi:hypothetical protein
LRLTPERLQEARNRRDYRVVLLLDQEGELAVEHLAQVGRVWSHVVDGSSAVSESTAKVSATR